MSPWPEERVTNHLVRVSVPGTISWSNGPTSNMLNGPNLLVQMLETKCTRLPPLISGLNPGFYPPAWLLFCIIHRLQNKFGRAPRYRFKDVGWDGWCEGCTMPGDGIGDAFQ